MNFKELEAFITLTKIKNFRKAAHEHNMTTSTLSRMILRLESEMNCVLFNRLQNGVQLTQNGEKFYEFATKSVNSYAGIFNEVNNINNEALTGQLVIAANPTMSNTLLPKIVRKFINKHPGVVINIVVSSTAASPLSNLYNDQYDYILQSGGGIQDSQSVSKNLSNNKIVLICPANGEKVDSLKQLKNLPFLRSEYPDMNTITEKIFHQNGIIPNKTTYVSGHEIICNMVAQNKGYAFMPKIMVDNFKHTNKIIIADLKEKMPTANICFRMKKQNPIPYVRKVFWDFLDDVQIDI